MTRWTARSEHLCGASDPEHLGRLRAFLEAVDGALAVRGGLLHVELRVEADDVVQAVTVAAVLLESAGLPARHATRLQVLHDRRVADRRDEPAPAAMPLQRQAG